MKSPVTHWKELSDLRHKVRQFEAKTPQFVEYVKWRQQIGRSETVLYAWAGAGAFALSATGFLLGKLL